jgi:hypothetical protein
MLPGNLSKLLRLRNQDIKVQGQVTELVSTFNQKEDT